MSSRKKIEPIPNRLLAALPEKEYRRLLPELELVSLSFGDILFEPGHLLRHVYFPHHSIISLLTAVDEREYLEVGLVGDDGMVGLSVFMGVNTSRTRALVQGTGDAMRMQAAQLRKESSNGRPLHDLLLRYTHSLLTQVSQTAACNRFHLARARLARWLLMTHDRIAGDEFRLTQQFLSHMLGVRREQVTIAARALQQQGLISYTRGQITILNRSGLEAAACKCYATVKDEYDNFLN